MAYIRRLNGEILGEVRTEPSGDITVLDYPSKKILAIYRKGLDKTTTLSGRVIS